MEDGVSRMMDIEKEIFKRSSMLEQQLVPYGFQKLKNKYFFSKKIEEDTFQINVEVSKDGNVQGKVIDLSFQDECINYRLENQEGEFAGRIRKQFEDTLLDIRKHCFQQEYFMTNQANRLANFIQKQYGDTPEFPWEKYQGYGVFKNHEKWYALVMNIDQSKLGEGNGEVEILNIKLAEDKIQELLKEKGFYQAYHMNKEKWITILLDNTLEDSKIIPLIEESYRYTVKANEWIIPANPKYYDVIHCFDDTDTIYWKQSNSIQVGDIVYLYVASPYSAILYQCEVLEVDIPYDYSDEKLSMSKVMQIRLQKSFGQEEYSFEQLKEYGVNAIRGPRSMPEKLSKAIHQEKNVKMKRG